MIAFLEGEIAASGMDYLVIQTGSVGVKVFTPATTVAKLRADTGRVRLETSLQVREDSLTLYGFAAAADREVFETLLSVSGVGPRLALAALSQLSGVQLQLAVANQDVAALQAIPGVGKKTAQRMILELASKLPSTVDLPAGGETSQPVVGGFESEVLLALEQLGWPRSQAEEAVNAVRGSHSDSGSLLKAALAWLSTSLPSR